MSELPKLEHSHSTFLSSSVICCKDSGYLTKAQAAEVIRRAEAYEGLVGLLRRVKNILEPFPVVADLKALKNTLVEARISEDEKINVEKLHKKWQAKTRKLYRDIEQALKEQPDDS